MLTIMINRQVTLSYDRAMDNLRALVKNIPRRYPDAILDELIATAGELPSAKVTYYDHSGSIAGLRHGVRFSGNTFDLISYWVEEGDEQGQEMSRRLALQHWLEYAAHQFSIAQNRKEFPLKSPSDSIAYYNKLNKACENLYEIINAGMKNGRFAHADSLLTFYGFSDIPLNIVSDVENALVKLQYKVRLANNNQKKKKIPRGKRYTANVAFQHLIANLCIIWRDVFNKVIAASATQDTKAGCGPMIRFIAKAIEPLNLTNTPASLRNTINRIKPDFEKHLVWF